MILSVVINDGTFATILGLTVTACFGTMAYIVKTLAAIDSRLAVVTEKVGGLERREVQRWGGQVGAIRLRFVMAVLALIAGLAVFWGALFLKVQSDDARRSDACASRQNLYDGQITYTRFLAKQFHATPEQTSAGLHELRSVLGPRPACD